MKAKIFKFKMMAIALAVPMLFAACNSDEPTPPNNEEPENPSPADPNTNLKPIIFETKSMFWRTDYDVVANIYNTLCSEGNIVYKSAAEVDNPSRISVSEFTIEMGDEKQKIDITELEKQASESPDGFFNVTLEGVTLKHEKKGELEILYDSDIDQIIYDAGLESRFYNIKLEGDNKKYATTLRVEDKISLISGMYLLNFDLTQINYPADRGYNDATGAKTGSYYVYLPATACTFPIVYDMGGMNRSAIKHFYLTNIYECSTNGEEELPLNLVEVEDLPGGASWFYVKESSIGRFTHKEFYNLTCEIAANTTGKERKFRLVISPDWDRVPLGALVPTDFYIIQAAE